MASLKPDNINFLDAARAAVQMAPRFVPLLPMLTCEQRLLLVKLGGRGRFTVFVQTFGGKENGCIRCGGGGSSQANSKTLKPSLSQSPPTDQNIWTW